MKESVTKHRKFVGKNDLLFLVSDISDIGNT